MTQEEKDILEKHGFVQVFYDRWDHVSHVSVTLDYALFTDDSWALFCINQRGILRDVYCIRVEKITEENTTHALEYLGKIIEGK